MSEIENAAIKWLESGQLYSIEFCDIYHSDQGAIEESEYVFLQANNLRQRWSTSEQSGVFCIADVGFGTGLNFLLSWHLWREVQPANRQLNYLAFEKHPLTHADLQRALVHWPQLKSLSDQLLDSYPDHTQGLHRICLDTNVTLDLFYGDVSQSLKSRATDENPPVDCWFLDGFDPRRNQSMWSEALAAQMALHSNKGTSLSTYSAAGHVKRLLQSVGFEVTKQPGFANKREMITAGFDSFSTKAPEHQSDRKPWFRIPSRQVNSRTAIVIGAGLAGCSTAYYLANKGWQVTVLDQSSSVAAGASGNQQAVLQCRLAAEASPQAEFYLHAYLFAHRQLQQLAGRHGLKWHNCGVARLLRHADSKLQHLANNLSRYYDPRVVCAETETQLNRRTGFEANHDALWLPHGGWLAPQALCEMFLQLQSDQPVRLITGQQVNALEVTDTGWDIRSANSSLGRAAVVILANSFESVNIEQSSFIPLLPVRGQLSQISTDASLESLTTVIAGERYLCPVSNGAHSIGASYQTGATDTISTRQDDKDNLAGLAVDIPALAHAAIIPHAARASIRCITSDYFPVIGAMPDYESFLTEFAALKRNARATISSPGTYLPGLYINSGHGSYGLSSTLFGSTLLASLINNENLPVTSSVLDALNPARFIIRRLKRQQD